MNDGEDLKPTPWSVARNWRFGPNPHDWFPLKGGTSCYIRGYLKMWHPPKTPWVPQFHHRFSHRNHPFIYHLRHIKTAKINRPNSVQIDPTLLRFPIIFRVFLHVRQGHGNSGNSWLRAPAPGGHWPEPSMPRPPGRSHRPGPGCWSATRKIGIWSNMPEYALNMVKLPGGKHGTKLLQTAGSCGPLWHFYWENQISRTNINHLTEWGSQLGDCRFPLNQFGAQIPSRIQLTDPSQPRNGNVIPRKRTLIRSCGHWIWPCQPARSASWNFVTVPLREVCLRLEQLQPLRSASNRTVAVILSNQNQHIGVWATHFLTSARTAASPSCMAFMAFICLTLYHL